MKGLINIKNASKIYSNGRFYVKALDNVSLTIDQGEFISIVGPSGSGKSTLLHIIGFLDRLDEGEYYFSGENVSNFTDIKLSFLRSKTVGFVFQSFHLLKNTTALDNVMLAMSYGGNQKDKNKALKSLEMVGLLDRITHKPNELSGGQLQRVAIARALVKDPILILADEPTGNLDSKSRAEVMQIFRELNKLGFTIIIVTHDEDIARETDRIIRMKDGKITNQEIIKTSKEPSITTGNKIVYEKSYFSFFELKEQISSALKSIFTNKLRSLLTILGIFIGVSSIISLMTVSDGLMKMILSSTTSEDSKKLWVSTKYHHIKKPKKLTIKEVEAIKTMVPLAEKVNPSIYRKVKTSYMDRKIEAYIHTPSGETIEKQSQQDFKFNGLKVYGRVYTPEEETQMEKVAVLNKTAASKLFKNDNPINSQIKINEITFKVIGVVEDREIESLFGTSPQIYIPINTAMKRLIGEKYIDSIEIIAPSPPQAQIAREQTVTALRKLHNKKDYEDDDFEVNTFDVQINEFKNIMSKISLGVYIVAGISLLVGGIGIMNIMFVSVTERTKEIGIRKALGAKKSDILIQFLIESSILCLIGGTMGIFAGYFISWIAHFIIKIKPSINIGTIFFAFGFSTLIGIIFGIWPASKAAKLNPIDALRYE